jgi:5'-nucleotidase/UDP-sugar diphosphatase
MGDLDRGYRAIDISGKDERLYSLTCPLMVAMILVAIPKYTKGKLTLVPKNKEGQPLKSKVEALDDPRSDTPDLLPPPGTTGSGQCRHRDGERHCPGDQGMAGDHGSPPQPAGQERGELPTIPVDERAAEVRAIKA